MSSYQKLGAYDEVAEVDPIDASWGLDDEDEDDYYGDYEDVAMTLVEGLDFELDNLYCHVALAVHPLGRSSADEEDPVEQLGEDG